MMGTYSTEVWKGMQNQSFIMDIDNSGAYCKRKGGNRKGIRKGVRGRLIVRGEKSTCV